MNISDKSNHIDMNKRDLKKLSKLELIKLLLKNKKPETIDKKNQKKAYNHNNLFNDDPFPDFTITNDPFERTMNKVHKLNNRTKLVDDAISDRYGALTKSNEDVIIYPKMNVSLNKFRKEEAKLTKSMRKEGSSFQKLFEKRLDGIEGPQETISITLFVEIKEGLLVVEKTYGPFDMDVPQLSKHDMYKFMVYTLLKNNFTLLSAQEIMKIGCKIITHNIFMNHVMGGIKLESYLLNKQKPIKSHGKNTCVVDYVWDQVRGKKGFKTYDYEKLKAELYSFAYDSPMISTEELINWAKECHDNVSIHAFDSRYKKFVTHSKHCSNILLVYIVKDHHCYPITNEKLKILASKANQGGCNDLLKHMCDLKWTRRHDNVTKIKSVNDVCNFDKENHIVVLPEGVKMNDAISLYSRNENLYVEYLHWNNNGILDGFIDHKKNMYLLNEEYDTRKTICDKLFNTFKTHDFKWTNQSYTSISTSLFKQLNGYIPESSYNVNARQMLDEYYPRALQWCTTEDIPEDVISIDIAKCYPSILLNNNNEIPIYTIHDVIEPFDSKEDLRKCGEFYIDETILDTYSNPIKIEAGFYSCNLVSYQVDTLNMPLSQIKHKIVTKRALKPDTFNEFIKYIFDNLPEGEAKKIANSFIGELGRKYNKTNHGFTCTEYETAMGCWTSAMSEGKSVTIDHHDGIYLIREQKIDRIFSDHTSINRFVVSEAILRMLLLIETCHGEHSVLYGYNTDGIYTTNPKTIFRNKKNVKFSTTKIGKAYVTDSKLVYFEKHYRENTSMSDYKIESGKGCIFNGQAGSGKTTKLCKMVQKQISHWSYRSQIKPLKTSKAD